MKIAALVTAAAFSFLSSTIAVGMPLSLEVNPNESNLNTTVQLLNGPPILSSVGTPTLSGSLNVLVGSQVPADYATVAVTGSNIALGTANMVINLGPTAGSLTFVLSGGQLAINTDSQPLSGDASSYSFDVAETSSFDLTAGTLSHVGSGILGGQFGTDSLNLVSEPLATSPIITGLGNLTAVHDVLTNEVFVTLTLPVNTTGEFTSGNVEGQFNLTGVIVATAVYAVPEPAGLALLALASVALIPAVCRARRK